MKWLEGNAGEKCAPRHHGSTGRRSFGHESGRLYNVSPRFQLTAVAYIAYAASCSRYGFVLECSYLLADRGKSPLYTAVQCICSCMIIPRVKRRPCAHTKFHR